jgi:hypothetical protein
MDMSMEHRWGMRRPLGIDVIVDYRPAAMGRGHIADASVSGLFVKTSLLLPLHARVKLVFGTREPGATRLQRLEAVVVRSTPDGVGLMYLRFNPREHAALLSLAGRDDAAGYLGQLGLLLNGARREAGGS